MVLSNIKCVYSLLFTAFYFKIRSLDVKKYKNSGYFKKVDCFDGTKLYNKLMKTIFPKKK